MTTETPDCDPHADDLLHDSRGNLIDSDYIDKVNLEAEVGYDLDDLAPARIGRPSLSDAGDFPQVRFRLPAATRAEVAALARVRSAGERVQARGPQVSLRTIGLAS
jgi:hypothetical protein